MHRASVSVEGKFSRTIDNFAHLFVRFPLNMRPRGRPPPKLLFFFSYRGGSGTFPGTAQGPTAICIGVNAGGAHRRAMNRCAHPCIGRAPCERCGHRRDMDSDRDGLDVLRRPRSLRGDLAACEHATHGPGAGLNPYSTRHGHDATPSQAGIGRATALRRVTQGGRALRVN